MRQWFLLTCGFAVQCIAAAQVDPNRLWLPKSYASHWSSLRAVAETAAASEACVKFLRGELARAKSSAEHPVFGITCLGEDNRSFVMHFDGLSLQSLEPVEAPVVGDSAVEVLAVLEKSLYEHCLAEWQNELAMMNNLSWRDSIENTGANRIETQEVDGSEVSHFFFARDFDATDVAGSPLSYTALCEGDSIDTLQVRIAPRKSD